MKRIKHAFMALALVAGIGLAAVPAGDAAAINVFNQCGGGSGGSEVCKAQGADDATSLMKNVINTMLFILGGIAVIMIVIGGVKYTTSNGNAADIKSAKDTVMYSVVGLIVAMMSYAIVNFVIDRF